MQFLNKLLQWLFSLQVCFSIYVSCSNSFCYKDPISTIHGAYLVDELVRIMPISRYDAAYRYSAKYSSAGRVLSNAFLAHRNALV